MNKIFKITCGVVLAFMLAACSSFSDDTSPYDTQESVKDVSGDWKLKTVSRNDADITDKMDFSQFVLHLNSDGSYQIDNYLPFIVSGNGTWKTDDPYMPFKMIFNENTDNKVEVELNYPIVDGERLLNVTFSPGCYSNVYTYTLERSSN